MREQLDIICGVRAGGDAVASQINGGDFQDWEMQWYHGIIYSRDCNVWDCRCNVWNPVLAFAMKIEDVSCDPIRKRKMLDLQVMKSWDSLLSWWEKFWVFNVACASLPAGWMRIESGRMYVGGAALCNMHLKLMHDRNATTLKKSTEPDLLHYRSTIDMDTLLSQMDKCACNSQM